MISSVYIIKQNIMSEFTPTPAEAEALDIIKYGVENNDEYQRRMGDMLFSMAMPIDLVTKLNVAHKKLNPISPQAIEPILPQDDIVVERSYALDKIQYEPLIRLQYEAFLSDASNGLEKGNAEKIVRSIAGIELIRERKPETLPGLYSSDPIEAEKERKMESTIIANCLSTLEELQVSSEELRYAMGLVDRRTFGVVQPSKDSDHYTDAKETAIMTKAITETASPEAAQEALNFLDGTLYYPIADAIFARRTLNVMKKLGQLNDSIPRPTNRSIEQEQTEQAAK